MFYFGQKHPVWMYRELDEPQLEEVQTYLSADSAESKVSAVAIRLGEPLSSSQPAETTHALAALKLFPGINITKKNIWFGWWRNSSITALPIEEGTTPPALLDGNVPFHHISIPVSLFWPFTDVQREFTSISVSSKDFTEHEGMTQNCSISSGRRWMKIWPLCANKFLALNSSRYVFINICGEALLLS